MNRFSNGTQKRMNNNISIEQQTLNLATTDINQIYQEGNQKTNRYGNDENPKYVQVIVPVYYFSYCNKKIKLCFIFIRIDKCVKNK